MAILAYHNVVEDADIGRGDRSLHLPLRDFVAQIERLARTHEIVELDGLPGSPGRSKPRAVVTFDDAYRGAVTLALPELTRRGIPAVVFVSPGLLGAAGTWWDEMGEAGSLTDEARRRALEELGGRTPAVRSRAFASASPPSLPPAFAIATREELLARVGAGISLGSHTWAHEHLPTLPADETRASLRRALEWLGVCGAPVSRWLALPYGAGGEAVSRIALELGHRGVLRIEGGPWRPSAGLGHVPRINVPAGVSLRGFDLRTSGVFVR